MNIKRIRPQPEEDLIAKILPKVPLTESMLIPGLMKSAKKILVSTLRNELEIYRQYPKQGPMNKLVFNPTHHKTCFMGQGFHVDSSEVGDAYLNDYRKAIGTLNHKQWGNATLLEIWAADHYDSHTAMVKGAFAYGKGDRNTCPVLKFHVFPLFANKQTGRKTFDDDDKDKFMYSYLEQLNAVRVSWKLKPIDTLDKEALKDANAQWEREKTKLF